MAHNLLIIFLSILVFFFFIEKSHESIARVQKTRVVAPSSEVIVLMWFSLSNITYIYIYTCNKT